MAKSQSSIKGHKPANRPTFNWGLWLCKHILFSLILVGGYWYFFRLGEAEKKETQLQIKSTWGTMKDKTLAAGQWASQTYRRSGSPVYRGTPEVTHYPNPLALLKNESYWIGYDEVRKNPAWSAYRIFKGDANVTEQQKLPEWKIDERTEARVGPRDGDEWEVYRRYILTHPELLIQSFGPEVREEQFLLSNTLLQTPIFRHTLWSRVEKQLDKLLAEREELWIVTGPLYDPKETSLGDKHIAMPDGMFALIIDETVEGLWLRALAYRNDANQNAPLEHGLISVDRLESLTGLNFLPRLNEDEAGELKSATPDSL